jgi:hypothetical protein
MQVKEVFSDYPQGKIKGNLARQRCINNYSMNNLTQSLKQVMSLVV